MNESRNGSGPFNDAPPRDELADVLRELTDTAGLDEIWVCWRCGCYTDNHHKDCIILRARRLLERLDE